MKVILLALSIVVISTVTSCGYEFNSKEISLQDDRGNQKTFYSCGQHMQVVSEGWGSSNFEVTFTDAEGLSHDMRGVKSVVVSDIPKTIQAPMWGFDEYVPGEQYSNPDGTLGELIKEGDTVHKGDNQARLVGGKWVPVMIHNTACDKTQS